MLTPTIGRLIIPEVEEKKVLFAGLSLLTSLERVEHDGHIRILTQEHGDLKSTWRCNNKEEVAAAKKNFDTLRRKGFLAYTVEEGGGKGKVLNEFDPKAEAIIMNPAPVGG